MNKKLVWLVIIIILFIGGIFCYNKYFLTSSDANTKYSYAVAPKETYIENVFKGNPDGHVVFSTDDLIFTGIGTLKKKSFDGYSLAAPEIIDPLRKINAPVQFSLFITPLKWSANEFWGAVSLTTGGDPPVNDAVSLFKINTNDWHITTYALPGKYINRLKEQDLNLNKNSVLLELATPENELYLYDYNFLNKTTSVIASYPNNIFSRFMTGNQGFIGYFYPDLAGVEPRQLQAKWIDDQTVSYTDFVTRREVVMKIDDLH